MTELICHNCPCRDYRFGTTITYCRVVSVNVELWDKCHLHYKDREEVLTKCKIRYINPNALRALYEWKVLHNQV